MVWVFWRMTRRLRHDCCNSRVSSAKIHTKKHRQLDIRYLISFNWICTALIPIRTYREPIPLVADETGLCLPVIDPLYTTHFDHRISAPSCASNRSHRCLRIQKYFFLSLIIASLGHDNRKTQENWITIIPQYSFLRFRVCWVAESACDQMRPKRF